MRQLTRLADRMVGKLAPKATAAACYRTGGTCPGSLYRATGCNGTHCVCYGMPGGFGWVCS